MLEYVDFVFNGEISCVGVLYIPNARPFQTTSGQTAFDKKVSLPLTRKLKPKCQGKSCFLAVILCLVGKYFWMRQYSILKLYDIPYYMYYSWFRRHFRAGSLTAITGQLASKLVWGEKVSPATSLCTCPHIVSYMDIVWFAISISDSSFFIATKRGVSDIGHFVGAF